MENFVFLMWSNKSFSTSTTVYMLSFSIFTTHLLSQDSYLVILLTRFARQKNGIRMKTDRENKKQDRERVAYLARGKPYPYYDY